MSTASPSRKIHDGGFHVLPVAMPGLQAVTAETARRFARHTHDQFGIGVIARGAQVKKRLMVLVSLSEICV